MCVAAFIIVGAILSFFVKLNEHPVINFVISIVLAGVVVLAILLCIWIGSLIIEGITWVVEDFQEAYHWAKEHDEKCSAIKEKVAKEMNTFFSPLTGKILKVNVYPGKVVKKGDILFVVEQNKMETEVPVPRDGVISEVLAAQGNDITNGDALITFTE